jgi:PAS domain S-box-containing protein
MNNRIFARLFSISSLRTKLIAATVSIVLIAVAVQGFVTNRTISATLQNNQNEILRSAASQTAFSLDGHINAELTIVRINALITDFQKYLGVPANERREFLFDATSTLQNLLKREPLYTKSYALLDNRGISVLDTNLENIGKDHSNEEYFQAAIQTNFPYVSPIKFLPDGSSVLYFASTVQGEAGNSVGVLLVTYDAAILQKWLIQNNNLAGPNSFPILLDENHIRLAHGAAASLIFKSIVPLEPDKVAELQFENRLPNLPPGELSTDLPEFKAGLENADTVPNFTARLLSVREEENAGAVVRLSTRPWLVAYFQPTSAYIAPVQEQARSSLLIAIGIASFMAIAAFFIAQSLSGPIVRLTAVAEKVAAGEINTQAEVESDDEIGTLATAFNSMTFQLRELIDSLEHRVADRTKSLLTVAEISTAASTILNIDNLLQETANLAKERFELYHAHIYLLDETGENLVLASGAGEIGRQMVAGGRSIPLEQEKSLVARAARERRGVTVNDVTLEPDFLPHPLLPDTRAELAVPMMVGENVIGVFDVQSDTVGRFSDADVSVQTTLAAQIASAIQNVRLFAETREATERFELAVAGSNDGVWDWNIVTNQVYYSPRLKEMVGYTDDEFGNDFAEFEEKLHPEDHDQVMQTVQDYLQGKIPAYEPVFRFRHKDGSYRWILARGSAVRDEKGVPVRMAGSHTDITESRLQLERTTKMAERETMLNLITQKIQSTTSMQEALQITARELGHALGKKPTLVSLDAQTKTTKHDESIS